ncbi:beta-galactosidase [Cohnella sp. CFH 77786]|uniref:beta-galactosidase trimerization domain-containing protein n=1 Tax=Cohnella sp. CFH 77786 TaxID=2662265 RepID=UPI001C60AF70|nr:beta-galactosidase trimerization domain-containing protein [Cohnella sp. CFH 77786]MBW5445273.1 beta-galactosidase [Cohnella sp. CFH 77786]
MRFRQVHLDFHTSEAIEGIGKHFSKAQFQEMLLRGCVDSITVFSKCHHGWAYHPSEANERHPELDFDLLGAMIEAAHEIGVKTPVYLSAGLDEKMARRHPEWLIRGKSERTQWAVDFMQPGYHEFCMNTPYLDYLLEQIREVVTRYDADGIFLDIVGVRECYCQHCVSAIRAEGADPRDREAMKRMWERTYRNYADRANQTVHEVKAGLPVFHNGGHIRRGRRDLAALNTHFELESLPTGGWGYDHFPLSVRYAQALGLAYLGMTGKFHTSWGEFGGYKHPNALRYETALCLANGARCSIGDQLHPEGLMDEATYDLIGKAYQEVKGKEKWCTDTRNIADVALLSLEAAGVHPSGESHEDRTADPDAGAVRFLLEGKFLFDVIDCEADFDAYRVILLPDRVFVDDGLKRKLSEFLQRGGKVLATGSSGMTADRKTFALDLGVRPLGPNPYRPSYIRPNFPLQALGSASFIMYGEGQMVELTDSGSELASQENPYFNRDIFTFCSHQHAPSTNVRSAVGMAEGPDGIYIAWNVFEDYADKGSLILKEMVVWALNRLLPGKTLDTDLPAQGVTTIQSQEEQNRWIHHLLYASPIRRGKGVEVIEDILPIRGTKAAIRVPRPVRRVYMAPQLIEIPFVQEGGIVRYELPEWECHQMAVIQF